MQTPFDLPTAIERAGGDTAVGAKLGKSSFTVARWRRGEAVPPTDEQQPLSVVLEVSLATLATWCAVKAAELRAAP